MEMSRKIYPGLVHANNYFYNVRLSITAGSRRFSAACYSSKKIAAYNYWSEKKNFFFFTNCHICISVALLHVK